MNTPAHALIGLALCGRDKAPHYHGAVLFGSLLPDLPMFGFFFWQTWVLETPQRIIWDERYFEPGWQALFDLFNSLPLIAAAAGLAWIWQNPAMLRGLAAMALHCLLDLPLHHDDGHRHFYPFSSWRFESPISYWDPNHYGSIGAGLEALVLVGAGAILVRRIASRTVQVLLATWIGLSVAAYVWLYWLSESGPAFE